MIVKMYRPLLLYIKRQLLLKRLPRPFVSSSDQDACVERGKVMKTPPFAVIKLENKIMIEDLL